MLINGQEYSWAQCQFAINGTVINGITKINYKNGQEYTDNYGAGQYPVSRSRGKYKAENVSMSLHFSEVQALTKAAPNRELTSCPMFDITVSYIPDLGQSPVTEKLRGCQFLSNSRDLSQSADGIAVDLELICAKIEW